MNCVPAYPKLLLMLRSKTPTKHLLRRGALLLFCLACTVPVVVAQSTGGVKGKVRNMRGDRIAGATITARQNGRDVSSTTSGSKGDFMLGGLEAGTYNIVFDARGYSSGVKYNVEIKANKTIDLGERLILQTDQGTQVIVRGSVFYKDGKSVPAARVEVERLGTDGQARKIASISTNSLGEFVFRQPEGAARFRITAKFKEASASKEIEVDTAAIYRLAISLDIIKDSE